MIKTIIVVEDDGTIQEFTAKQASVVPVISSATELWNIKPEPKPVPVVQLANTISVESGTMKVVGDGTAFLSTFQAGDKITAGGQTHVVTQVESDTVMYTGVWPTGVTNVTYSKA